MKCHQSKSVSQQTAGGPEQRTRHCRTGPDEVPSRPGRADDGTAASRRLCPRSAALRGGPGTHRRPNAGTAPPRHLKPHRNYIHQLATIQHWLPGYIGWNENVSSAGHVPSQLRKKKPIKTLFKTKRTLWLAQCAANLIKNWIKSLGVRTSSQFTK